ncbi:MAG: hypothetical protein UU41_C0010G0001 [Candidatus Roizmanbacteria bacterium GW2011_GWA1_41_13]|uniref:Uncharacterized protein n=1 Tax=Candidatus Roizmanbacteria bacterium GW2011_GWA1_41_13 TaxID=1618474 RepID=A0A0G0UZT6_9BACT|nr:MAG: hypothetical protein UU41_C0010G0001 [Candidatus Roizmanbacteria bacterium GW2011_GWA1_41_13]
MENRPIYASEYKIGSQERNKKNKYVYWISFDERKSETEKKVCLYGKFVRKKK